jgi:glycosidase
MIAPAWIRTAVFYQLFPDRFANGDSSLDPPGTVHWDAPPTRTNFFGGDLAGITAKLGYLADMGFNALYLNPIFAAGTNHRYDTADYYRIDPALGDDAAFDALITEAHKRGLRVVLDGVFNHCGLGFGPFVDVCTRGEHSRYRHWFHVYNWPVRHSPEPNYATCGGAHYLPRLNTHNREVEQFIHEVALHWLDHGVDGWRLDVAYEIAPDFWRRFRSAVKARYPEAYLVAEEWRDAGPHIQGDTFDGAMHYELRGLALDFFATNALTGEAFSRALTTLLGRYPEGAVLGMLNSLGTHDTERLHTACGGNEELTALMYVFLFAIPGTPMIYYGDENGMEGQNDPDCRRPMIWDPSRWSSTIRSTITTMIDLRRRRVSLRKGAVRVLWANDRAIAIERASADETTIVILNNSRVERTLEVPLGLGDVRVMNCLTGEVIGAQSGTLIMESAQPFTYAVLDVQE